jgi:hypothetical protein
MELAVNVIMIMFAGIGAALFYVGSLIAAVTAFRHKQYVYGALSLLFFPVSIAYCLQYTNKGTYAAKFLLGGALLMLIAFGLAKLFYTI